MSLFISHIHANCHYYLQHLDYFTVILSFLCCLIIYLILYISRGKNMSFKDIAIILIVSIYTSILLAITLFGRGDLEKRTNVETPSSIKLLIEGNVSIIFDVLFNVLLFIPAGILLSIRYRVLPSSIVILSSTIGIEMVQAITNKGRFEVIDLIANFLGGLIGIGFYHLIVICIKTILRNKKAKDCV